MMERRVLGSPLEIEERSDGTPVIRGMAAVYNKKSRNLGGFREILASGAFDDVLSKKNAENDVICCWNHEPGNLLGRTSSGTLKLESTEEGLAFEVDPPDTSLARDLMTMVRRGDVFGSSFAFTTDRDFEEWDEDDEGPIRTVRKVTGLYDVSLVTNPAYLDTSVAVRSLEEWKTTVAERMPQPPYTPSVAYLKAAALARAATLAAERIRR